MNANDENESPTFDREFVDDYYKKWLFYSDEIYGEDSILSYDGKKARGQAHKRIGTLLHSKEYVNADQFFQDIRKTVISLGYQTCKARIHSVSGLYGVNDSLTLQVCGELSFNGGVPRKFLQVLALCKRETGKYYVLTDIFQWVDKVFCPEIAPSNGHHANGNASMAQNKDAMPPQQQNEGSNSSFDAADNLIQANFVQNVGLRPVSPMPLEVQNTMTQVANRIEKVIKVNGINKLTKISEIRSGNFYNGVFQVIGIAQNPSNDLSVYLRVVDGTMPNFPPHGKQIKKLASEKWDDPSCDVDREMNRILEAAAIDVLCYDEFKPAAERCEPGDIILLWNFRVQELESFHFIKMNGNGKIHKRSLKVLAATPNVAEIETIDLDEDEPQDIKFPIAESVMGSPCNKRQRLDVSDFGE